MKRALLLLLLLGVVSGGVVSDPASAAIDPFYQNRMESGIRAFDLGNWEAAARQLRIACFGHLDEPSALVEGLVRLAIAEARSGDEDAFRQVFTRLIEIEERFSTYPTATIPAPVRSQFEGLAAQLVPAQSLQAVEGFRPIADRAETQRLADLPPAQRRAELESRIQAEPGRSDWLIEMARLELAVRRPQPALDWLDRLTGTDAQVPPATCLRQQAASEAGDCARMDLTGTFCGNVPADVVEFRLQCLVDAGRWPEASALIRDMDPALRSRRRVTRLERRVRNNVGDSVPIESAASPAEVAMPRPEGTEASKPAAAEIPPAEPAPAGAAIDTGELDQLHERLTSAVTADELAALRGDAESFADLHPESRPARLLVAEIAYLQSDWPAAVEHFRQAGPFGLDEAHLAFYQAVALYESGDPQAAAAVLRPVAARLERTGFAAAYLDRILPPGI